MSRQSDIEERGVIHVAFVIWAIATGVLAAILFATVYAS